jgi:peroxiredoxin
VDYDGGPPIIASPTPPPSLWAATRTATGEPLGALASQGPLLLVFLRHFGCPLCQEMVADVAARRAAILASGTTVVFVHMHPEPQAADFFARYGVADLQRVSDPDRTLYRAYDMARATPSSWFSLGTLRHYLDAIVRGRHRPALVGGDLLQMAGVVRLVDGRVEQIVRDRGFETRPDFDDLLACPTRP